MTRSPTRTGELQRTTKETNGIFPDWFLCPKLSLLRQCGVMSLKCGIDCNLPLTDLETCISSEIQTSMPLRGKQIIHKAFSWTVLLLDKGVRVDAFIRETCLLNWSKNKVGQSQDTVRDPSPMFPTATLSHQQLKWAFYFQNHTRYLLHNLLFSSFALLFQLMSTPPTHTQKKTTQSLSSTIIKKKNRECTMC